MITVQDLTIEIADSPQAKDAVYRFRYQIYAEEFGFDLGPAAEESKQLVDHLDSTGQQYAAKAPDGDIIGTFRINRLDALSDPCEALSPLPIADLLEHTPAETITYTSRVMVRADWRGTTALSKMSQRFVSDLVDMGIHFDTCFSGPGLVEFFEKLGYRRFGEGIVIQGLRFNFPMLLAVNDQSHLRRAKSPLGRRKANTSSSSTAHTNHEWIDTLCSAHGSNHRLMTKNEFWAIAGDALMSQQSTTPLLQGFSNDEAEMMIKISPILDLQPGNTIMPQGIFQEDLYIVINGELEATWTQDGVPTTIKTTLTPGSMFGESEFIDPKPSPIEVTAITTAKVLVINQNLMRKALGNQPALTTRLLRNLGIVISTRLADAYRHLTSKDKPIE